VSLFLFPEISAFRKWCFNLVANAWFERLVIAVILVRKRFCFSHQFSRLVSMVPLL
jgi:hypothetical protein